MSMKTKLLVLITGLSVALAGSTVAPTSVRAQTVGYSLDPGASWVVWDDDLGIEDGWMWGGALTFELGSRVRLSPFYLTRSDLGADPTEIEGDAPAFPDAQAIELDIRHLGVDFDLDLTSGPVVPFLRLGGGVLRLDPGDRDALERIALTYGGGIRFGVGRAGIRLFAEGTSYRLAAERLYAPEATIRLDEPDRQNVVAGARVSIPISSRPQGSQVGLTSASAPFGLFVGELDFADETGLGSQRLAGVRAGIAFSPLVSLLGFYWSGVNDDFDATEDIRGYGAEARFDLGSGTGVSPFVVAGGGRIDFDDDPDGEDIEPRGDQTALILGGGLSFRLSDRVDLSVSARDYLMDSAGELEDASDPGDLTSNWLYGAGLSVRLGGSTAAGEARERAEARRAEEERLLDELERLRAQREDTAGAPARVPMGDSVVPTPADTTMGRVVRTPEGRVITLPVLEEGAIYIRFGPEGADTRSAAGDVLMDRADLRRMIREELRTIAGDTTASTPSEIDALEARILERLEAQQASDTATDLSSEVLERLDAIERRLNERIDDLARQRAPAVAQATPQPVIQPTAVATSESAWDRAGRLDVSRTLPYAGVSAGEETQAVVGFRLDFGPLKPGSALHFVPEAAFGFGEGDATLLVLGNVQLGLGRYGGSRDVRPYVTGGVGFFSPSFLAVNTGFGAEFDLRADPADPLRSFVEVQGINLFDRTRLLVGFSIAN